MSKHKRYEGELVSLAGVVWRVELWQEHGEAWNVGELTFEGSEALVIEWPEKGKEESLEGSVATLRIESPGDRTYADLALVSDGDVRMDVYRDGSLYWRGLLDSEGYEEPYEQAARYAVALKFSDLGLLDRQKWHGSGMQLLGDILLDALEVLDLGYAGWDESLISSELGGARLSLDMLSVSSENFYDEDGEALSLKEVLEGILQPLGLRLTQRGGRLWVYDLNGLWMSGSERELVWDGSHQTMSMDRTYSEVKVTWSPYVKSGLLGEKACWTEEYDENLVALDTLDGVESGSSRYYSYPLEKTARAGSSEPGFTLWVSCEGSHAHLTDRWIRFFKMVPQWDGEEHEGVAICFSSVRHGRTGNPGIWETETNGEDVLSGSLSSLGVPLWETTDEIWLPRETDASKLQLRLVMGLLVDPRWNPFEDAWDEMLGNETSVTSHRELVSQKEVYDLWKSDGNFLYWPVLIRLETEDGHRYVWDNRMEVGMDIGIGKVRDKRGTMGRWVEYDDSSGHPNAWGYLAWYDAEDRKKNCGVLGWKENRPAINPHTDALRQSLRRCDAGQYLPYPDFGQGVRLHVDVHAGCLLVKGGRNVSSAVGSGELWDVTNWVLMGLPQFEVLRRRDFDDGLQDGDVEYSMELNSSAHESLELDEICGSSADGVPLARGCYVKVSDGLQLTELTRGVRTSQLEDLLGGTLYSQYGERRLKLSGEAVIASEGLSVWTEQNQPGKKFLLVGDTEDVQTDTSQAVIVELRPDEYKKEGES